MFCCLWIKMGEVGVSSWRIRCLETNFVKHVLQCAGPEREFFLFASRDYQSGCHNFEEKKMYAESQVPHCVTTELTIGFPDG